jgi:hypothetical protein
VGRDGPRKIHILRPVSEKFALKIPLLMNGQNVVDAAAGHFLCLGSSNWKPFGEFVINVLSGSFSYTPFIYQMIHCQ